MPVWLLDLLKTSPYAAVTIIIVRLIVKNWCRLLGGTVAVLHQDEKRRADALKVYRAEGDEPPGIEPAPGQPSRAGRRRRRRRRR
ncbi:hypothetical protein ACFPIJ_63820 [Dactylosporangium cerinum]|uniref:Uncharacterized protein n=1 Tax=Dactylosporangium cerinum TaxID=1434730 RepID=A0ABV9WM07_9ACTN